MKLFKNEVGRPSNETKRKRRNFYIVISAVAVVLLCIGGYFIVKYFAANNLVSDDKNVSVAQLKKNFSANVSIIESFEPSWYFDARVSKAKNNNKKPVYVTIDVYKNGKKINGRKCTSSVNAKEFYDAHSFGVGFIVKNNDKIGINYSVFSDNKCKNKITTIKKEKKANLNNVPLKLTTSKKTTKYRNGSTAYLYYNVGPKWMPSSRKTYIRISVSNKSNGKHVKTVCKLVSKYNSALTYTYKGNYSNLYVSGVGLYSDSSCKKMVDYSY